MNLYEFTQLGERLRDRVQAALPEDEGLAAQVCGDTLQIITVERAHIVQLRLINARTVSDHTGSYLDGTCQICANYETEFRDGFEFDLGRTITSALILLRVRSAPDRYHREPVI